MNANIVKGIIFEIGDKEENLEWTHYNYITVRDIYGKDHHIINALVEPRIKRIIEKNNDVSLSYFDTDYFGPQFNFIAFAKHGDDCRQVGYADVGWLAFLGATFFMYLLYILIISYFPFDVLATAFFFIIPTVVTMILYDVCVGKHRRFNKMVNLSRSLL